MAVKPTSAEPPPRPPSAQSTSSGNSREPRDPSPEQTLSPLALALRSATLRRTNKDKDGGESAPNSAPPSAVSPAPSAQQSNVSAATQQPVRPQQQQQAPGTGEVLNEMQRVFAARRARLEGSDTSTTGADTSDNKSALAVAPAPAPAPASNKLVTPPASTSKADAAAKRTYASLHSLCSATLRLRSAIFDQ